MLSRYASHLKDRAQTRTDAPKLGPRREASGGWIHDSAAERHQPQDGSSQAEARQRVSEVTSVMMEPEDARLTGGTRSLMRRLTGLNISRPLSAVKSLATPSLIANMATMANKTAKEAARKLPSAKRLRTAPGQAA